MFSCSVADTSGPMSWLWVALGFAKGNSESMMAAAQDHALWTKWIKANTDNIKCSLKVLRALKGNLEGFSDTVHETRTLRIFDKNHAYSMHTPSIFSNKTIDGLNLKKPFWVFSNSPTTKPSMVSA